MEKKDNGISVYGPNKALRRRLIHHVVYHERPLFEAWQTLAPSLSREPIGHPQTTWQWARPEGINPRQTNRWVLRDQARLAFGHPPVAAGSQDLEQGYPTPYTTPAYRQVTREHHQVDTAMFQRVQGVIASLQALEPLLRQVPAGVQAQMVEPASDLHADLMACCLPPSSLPIYTLMLMTMMLDKRKRHSVTLFWNGSS